MTRCFLIEDDLDDQDIFLMALREIDPTIECQIADGGQQALDKLSTDRSFVPDYIFVDLNMPKMNGLDCLSELKKIEHLQAARIIMFSTSSEPKIVENSRLLGADNFLVKPSAIGHMVTSITKLIVKR